MPRTAVIGAGISGLACAWLLAKRHDVVVFESRRFPGGHINTVDVTLEGTTYPVDAGFLVYNDRNYPNLAKLFAALGVESATSDMSFSVRIGDGALEWSGSSLATVFAQPSNLVRPRFLRMLADLLRFNREASRIAQAGGPVTGTLGEFLDARGFGREVRELYLIPMAASIWTTPATQINRFPLATFLRFCASHGLLSASNRPHRRTVKRRARVREEARGIAARRAPRDPRAKGEPFRRPRRSGHRSRHRALRRGGPRDAHRRIAGPPGEPVGRGARRPESHSLPGQPRGAAHR